MALGRATHCSFPKRCHVHLAPLGRFRTNSTAVVESQKSFARAARRTRRRAHLKAKCDNPPRPAHGNPGRFFGRRREFYYRLVPERNRGLPRVSFA